MKREKIKLLTLSSALTAITFVLTAYLQIPSNTGYVHVGDAVIYLSACILPLPYAIFVGAVGGGLADLLSGFGIWAPATVAVKGISVLFFSRSKRFLSARNTTALVPATIVSVCGYYLYEAMLLKSFIAPALGIPGYVMQAVLSCALFAVLGAAFDKMNLKSKL